MNNKYPVHIKEIKKGDLFYEFAQGDFHKFRALENAIFDPKNKQWSFIGYWIQKNEDIRFLVTQDYEGYGPKLFKSE